MKPDEKFQSFREGFRLITELLAEATAQHTTPPPSPGRGKRNPEAESYAQIVGECAALAKRPGLHPVAKRLAELGAQEASEIAADATLAGDSATLAQVLDGISSGDKATHSGFSRHVVAALRAKRTLLSEGNGELPTKGTVRERAEAMLRADGVDPFLDDHRWKEVFAAANLKYLPQSRAKRGKSKWGE